MAICLHCRAIEADPVQYDNTLGLFYTRSVDPDGHATLTYADAQGRTVRTAYADGSFAETLYSVDTTAASADAEGDAVPTPTGWGGITGGGYEVVHVAQRKAGDAPVYAYDLYDAAGRLTDVWQAAVANGAGTDPTPVNPHWQYTYDTAGNETAQVSGAGNTAYANPAEFTTSWAYDPNGNKVGQTLPDGELQTWAYDVHGNNTSHKVYSAADPTTALQTTLDTYDASAAHGGRLVAEDRYGSDQPLGSTATPDERTAYTYDDSETLPLAERAGQGNVAEVDDDVLPTGGTTLVRADFTHYTYDPISGSQATITTADGTVHYGYDEATGNLVETWTGANPSAPQSAAQNDVLYGYDSQGRLASVTQVVLNGSVPPPVSGGTRYDADGNPIVTNEPTTDYTYDPAGNLLTDAEPNGDTTAYTYNGLNQVTDEAITNGAGKLLFGEHTDWTDDGQKRDVVDTRGDGAGRTTSQTTTAWTYDADNRLTGETLTVQSGSGTSVPTPYSDTFAYDLNGNRISQSHVTAAGTDTTTSTYNGDNELTQTVDGQAGTTTFTYDGDGSQTSSTNGGVTTTYTYDLRNRLASVTAGGVTTTYGYDDAGNRVSETTGGTTTYYLIDTQNPTGYDQPIEAKSSPTAAPSESYIIGDRVLGQANGGGQVSYLLSDGHGSTRLITNASGAVTATLNYDAFGNPLNFNPATVGTIWQFGGDGYYDPASGLTFHSSGRQSSSFLGRFITEDEQGFMVQSDPITGNLYILDDANPVNGSDPSGHDDDVDVLAAIGINAGLESGNALSTVAAGGETGAAADSEFGLYEDAVENEMEADEIGTNGGLQSSSTAEPDDAGAAAEINGDDDAALPQVRQNQIAGDAREAQAFQDWQDEYPDDTVLSERTLRDADGNKLIDPVTGTGRRVDFVVVNNEGEVVNVTEVTSETADKTGQIAKTERIRDLGDTYIRNPNNGELIRVPPDVPQNIVRLP